MKPATPLRAATHRHAAALSGTNNHFEAISQSFPIVQNEDTFPQEQKKTLLCCLINKIVALTQVISTPFWTRIV